MIGRCDAERIRKARRAQRTWRLVEQEARTRALIVRELNRLAARPVPPIAARAAANWTLTAPPAPDALIDVWIAVEDWVEAGRPPYGPPHSDPRNDPYARLLSNLTVFDTHVRYGHRNRVR